MAKPVGAMLPATVPLLRLSNGGAMPMLSIGSGGIPPKQAGRGRKRHSTPVAGSVRSLLNASLHLGFRGIDTSEVYPLFDEVPGHRLEPGCAPESFEFLSNSGRWARRCKPLDIVKKSS